MRFASTDKLRRDISNINHGETKGWQALVHSGRTKNTIRNSGNSLPKISWMRWSYFTFLAWKLLKQMKLVWNISKHTWFFYLISWHYYKLLFIITSMRSKSWLFEAKTWNSWSFWLCSRSAPNPILSYFSTCPYFMMSYFDPQTPPPPPKSLHTHKYIL